ncbi:hypothetical protein [Sporosarcina sp. NPDC096371]|uniref:hypothetical protein n=1 Tax=Sporosarcina sp. NPDC096371 TaxID=3364530 RepID=UPI0038062BCE
MIENVIMVTLIYGAMTLLTISYDILKKIIFGPLVIITLKLVEELEKLLKTPTLIYLGLLGRVGFISLMMIVSSLILLLIISAYMIIFNETIIKTDEFFSWVNVFINNYSKEAVLLLISMVFYFEYKIYCWLLRFLGKTRLAFSEPEINYLKKILLADFTVLIVFLGLLPILIDITYGNFGFSKDIQDMLFFCFLSGVVPYTHLVYEQVK